MYELLTANEQVFYIYENIYYCLNLDAILKWIELYAYHKLVKSKVVKMNPNFELKLWVLLFYVKQQENIYLNDLSKPG